MEGDKKMKGLKKIAALLMAVLLMVGGNVETLYASEHSGNDIMLLSLDETKSASLTISSGTAKATCIVIGTSKRVDKIVINMYLQKKNKNGVWENYKSWYETENSYIHTLSKSCSVPSGTYRVMVRVICYDGSKAETSYLYTGSKTR